MHKLVLNINKVLEKINYELILNELCAYGFGKEALEIFFRNQSNLHHWVNIDSMCGSWRSVAL